MSAEMPAHAAAGAGPAASLSQEQQQHAAQLDAASLKLTRGTSCVLCQQRKVRCDKNKPCANCVKAGVECRVIPPQPPRRRKKRLQEKDLIERLKKYELLLSEHGVKFDAITQDLRGDGPQLDDVDELENDFEGLKTTPRGQLISGEYFSSRPAVCNSVPLSMFSFLIFPRSNRAPGTWFPLHREVSRIFNMTQGPLILSTSSEPVRTYCTTLLMTKTQASRQSTVPLTKCSPTRMVFLLLLAASRPRLPIYIHRLYIHFSFGRYTSTISTHY